MKAKKQRCRDSIVPKLRLKSVCGETSHTKSIVKSLAHERSIPFIIDPLYGFNGDLYQSEKLHHKDSVRKRIATCFYHPVQLEQYRLCLMRQQSKNAGMHVYYPLDFLPCHEISDKILYFRPKCQIKNRNKNTFKISSNGTMEIIFNENSTTKTLQAHQWESVSSLREVMMVKISTHSTLQTHDDISVPYPPCLVCNCNQIYWECNVDIDDIQQTWIDASDEKMVENESYPHDFQQEDSFSSINIFPKKSFVIKEDQNVIYDFGLELMGKIRVKIECHQELKQNQPKMFVGESIEEAGNENPNYFEQSSSLSLIGKEGQDEIWQSDQLLAFRYVRLNRPHIDVKNIECIALFHPVEYKGAFASSDNIFTDIWIRSAYTLRLCFHRGVIVDGIKRDRLPWAGDLAVSILANAYTFVDSKVIQKTLLALDQITISKDNNISHVNGVVDYSLWWIISHHLYQLHFQDTLFLRKCWPGINASLSYLLKKSVHEHELYASFLRWKNSQDDEMDTTSPDWLFIDWGLENTSEKFTCVQILWWWALTCGIALANRIEQTCKNNDSPTIFSMIQQLQEAKVKLELQLYKNCWDEKEGLWLSSSKYLTNEKLYSRHACILSIISGFHKSPFKNTPMSSKKFIDSFSHEGRFHAKVGTPFFKFLECAALNSLGEPLLALKEARKYWNSMIEKGATTFWEAFDMQESSELPKNFEMYDRMYGKSLCHSWSSGPCQLIPIALFGVRPLKDGWSKWTCYNRNKVHGMLKKLDIEWASVTVPISKEDYLSIDINQRWMNICVPNKTTLEIGKSTYLGPADIYFKSAYSPCRRNTVRNLSSPYRNWHYYSDHVIPPKPNINGFEDIIMTDVPTIFQLPEKDNNVWYMSFIGYDNKGYQSFVAESNDLINWKNFRLAFGYGNAGEFDYGGRVLGGYLYEDYSIKSRRVLKRVNGKFWCLYGSYAKRGGYEIDPGYEGVAYSDDGLIWQRAKNEPILSVQDKCAGKWEKGCIYQPWLIEINGKYFNLYNAKTAPPYWIEQIGLATSNDLFNWKRYSANPVLRVRPESSHDHFAAGGKVYWDDHAHQWVMFFFGVDKTNHAHIMIAFSHDLYHWEVDEKPLYEAGGHPLGLDKEHAHKVSLVWNHVKKSWFLFYDAVGNKGRGIGLLTSVGFT